MALGIIGTEEALGSATNLSLTTRSRVYNSTTGDLTITRRDSEGTAIGTMTLAGGATVELWKDATDTLEGGAGLLASPVTDNS